MCRVWMGCFLVVIENPSKANPRLWTTLCILMPTRTTELFEIFNTVFGRIHFGVCVWFALSSIKWTPKPKTQGQGDKSNLFPAEYFSIISEAANEQTNYWKDTHSSSKSMGLEAMGRMEPNCETSSWITRNSTSEEDSKLGSKVTFYEQQLQFSPRKFHWHSFNFISAFYLFYLELYAGTWRVGK